MKQLLSSAERAAVQQKVRSLSRVDGWRSTLAFAGEWAVIACAVAVAQWSGSPAVAVACIVLIGTRQHALAILAHEGAHRRLYRSARANTVAGNLLAAYPLFFQIEAYAHSHLQHHRRTNHPDDPDIQLQSGCWDWRFPMSGRALLGIVLLDLAGRGALLNLQRMLRYSAAGQTGDRVRAELRAARPVRLAFHLAAAAALAWSGAWAAFALYWLVPLLFVLPALLRLRNIFEHYGLDWSAGELQQSRNTLCGPVERFLLAPHAIGLHLVHHLYPSVPARHLPELHRFLMGFDAYRAGAHNNRSYLLPRAGSALREVLR